MSNTRRRRHLILLLAFFAVSVVADPSWAQLPRIFGGRREVKYQLYKDSANLFEVDYPERDWRMIPVAVGGNVAVQFSHKDGAAFMVEHVRMPAALTDGERAAMEDAELDRVRSQERATKDFKTESLETRSGPCVAIRYQQIARGPERVVQCTLAVGVDLFRLYGVMPERLLAQLEPVAVHMIGSFKTPAVPAASEAKPPAPPR
jgi:hypothetical protein